MNANVSPRDAGYMVVQPPWADYHGVGWPPVSPDPETVAGCEGGDR